MARPTRRLIQALHVAIDNIDAGAHFQWGHMGGCNCGHLAQALTQKDKKTIHAAALKRAGDWGEQAIDYCPTSGLPIDHIITTMLDAGLELHDIDNLERLRDPEVLDRLPEGRRWLRRNRREDALKYMRTWVRLLEEQLEAQTSRTPDRLRR